MIFCSVSFTFHSGSVESDIPICQVLKEGEDVSEYVVEPVVVHFDSNLLDHVLASSNNVPVHNVRLFILEHGIFLLRIKYEVFTCSLFPSLDVLDAEAI